MGSFCGVDVFLLGPKFNTLPPGLRSNGDAGQDQRWRVAIYGDMESAEHAKTRILIFIDRLVSGLCNTGRANLTNYSLAELLMR